MVIEFEGPHVILVVLLLLSAEDEDLLFVDLDSALPDASFSPGMAVVVQDVDFSPHVPLDVVEFDLVLDFLVLLIDSSDLHEELVAEVHERAPAALPLGGTQRDPPARMRVHPLQVIDGVFFAVTRGPTADVDEVTDEASPEVLPSIQHVAVLAQASLLQVHSKHRRDRHVPIDVLHYASDHEDLPLLILDHLVVAGQPILND